jgi:hypothetical protein
MIDVALVFVRQVLDQYLVASFGQENGIVVLNNLINSDGQIPEKNKNKIVITLVNLEYETNKQFYGGQRRDEDQFSQVNPVLYFNLDILISASFDEYSESLKLLTAIIGFFQENLAFSRANNPTLPEGISLLKFEIENSSSVKMQNLWTALGAKYLPSIIYKIRHVAVQGGQIKGSSAVIQDVSGSATP